MTTTFYNPKWVETLRQIHKEMMDEKALYEELSDEHELTDAEMFAMGHYFERGISEQATDDTGNHQNDDSEKNYHQQSGLSGRSL